MPGFDPVARIVPSKLVPPGRIDRPINARGDHVFFPESGDNQTLGVRCPTCRNTI